MVKDLTAQRYKVRLNKRPTHVSSKPPGPSTLCLIVIPIMGIKNQFLNLNL